MFFVVMIRQARRHHLSLFLIRFKTLLNISQFAKYFSISQFAKYFFKKKSIKKSVICGALRIQRPLQCCEETRNGTLAKEGWVPVVGWGLLTGGNSGEEAPPLSDVVLPRTRKGEAEEWGAGVSGEGEGGGAGEDQCLVRFNYVLLTLLFLIPKPVYD